MAELSVDFDVPATKAQGVLPCAPDFCPDYATISKAVTSEYRALRDDTAALSPE
jgi:hypothetical protein